MREDLQELVKQYGTAKLRSQKKNIESAEVFLEENEKVWYVCAGVLNVIRTGSGESFAKAPWLSGVYFFTDQRIMVVYTPPKGEVKLYRSLPYTEKSIIKFKPEGALTNIMITAEEYSYNLSASSKSVDTKPTKIVSSGIEEYALSHLSLEEVQEAQNILQITDDYLEKKLHLNDASKKITSSFNKICSLNQSALNNKLYMKTMQIFSGFDKKINGENIDDEEIANYRNELEAELNALPEDLQVQNMPQDNEEKLSESSQQESSPDEDASIEEIKKYKSLLDDGIITEEEFEAKKKQLLGL